MTFKITVAALGLSLAACNQTDTPAEKVEEQAEVKAEVVEDRAEVVGEMAEDAEGVREVNLEAKAENLADRSAAIEESGEVKAEAMDDAQR